MNPWQKFTSWTSRKRLGLIVIGIFLLGCITLGYDSLEVYNANVDGLNARLHGMGLRSITLSPIHTRSWPPETFRLGLDLKGGTHLVYDTDLSRVSPSERSAAVEGVRDVIERRVNAFGVSEPNVQVVKVGDSYRVAVELAGVHDVNQAIKLIGDTPLLEFKEQKTSAEQQTPPQLTPDQQNELNSFNAKAQKTASDVLAKARVPGADFGALAKEFSQDPASKEKGGDVGWVSNSSPNAMLVFPVEKLKPGETAKDLFGLPQGQTILKLLETRTATEVAANHILICYKGATRCDKQTSKEDAKKQIDELKKKATPENFTQLAKDNSTEPGAKTSGGDLGYFGKGVLVPAFETAAFALKKGAVSDVVETEFGYHLIFKRDERPSTEYHIAQIVIKIKTQADFISPLDRQWKDTGLTGKQLKRAQVNFNGTTGFPEVDLEFNDEGKNLFADITKRNVEKPVGIFLDKQPISEPTVRQPITDGRAVIEGNFAVEEAKLLAQRLTTGALPVPITLVSQQTVGAALGSESLQKSLHAGLIGFALVALFMILFYRLPGFLAVLALCIYTFLTLAVFKIWPVTLTLAGIAGFILSIGMAVDANILIFERVKEELRWGRSLNAALANGFTRAWTSIRDSNISSLITCAILFWFSASLIKGFAFTLALGILLSMFSAIVITRITLRFVSSLRAAQNVWLFSGKAEKIDSSQSKQ